MNSRERILAVFDGELPDRIPIWIGVSGGFAQKAGQELGLSTEQLHTRLGIDFHFIHAQYTRPVQANRTPFGVERAGFGCGQAVSNPLADATLQEIHEYPWPDPNAVRLTASEAVRTAQYAVFGGNWCPFWHDLIDLLGMENMYFKMYDDPLVVDTILQYIVDYYVAANQNVLDATAQQTDVFYIADDFGTARGPLISPVLFERFILPHLRRLIHLGHSYGLDVMLHCCGGFVELIPSLIEAGLDALQALQPCNGMEPTRLKAEFGNKIVLAGGIDSVLLINGTPDKVREHTRQVVEILKPGGGYLSGPSHDGILPATSVKNVLVMVDTIREFGKY